MAPADLLAIPSFVLVLALGSLIDLSYAKRSARIKLDGQPEPEPEEAVVGDSDPNIGIDLKGEKEGSVDGQPIHEEAFWRRIRRRKMFLGINVVLLICMRTFALGWNAIAKDEGEALVIEKLAEDGLLVLFWSMTLVIVALSYSETTVNRHWRYVIHLSILTFAYFVCTWGRLLTPSSSIHRSVPDDTPPEQKLLIFETVLVWTDAVLGFTAFLVAATTPRGPYLFFRSPYATADTDAEVSAESKAYKEKYGNVNLIACSSPIEYLLFSWVTPIIRSGYKNEQLHPGDLPNLTSEFRALNLYRKITASIRKASVGQTGNFKNVGKAPRWTNALLWRVLVVNKGAFGVQVIMALVNSVLYYLPALMLQKIVHFLEAKPEEKQESVATGYAYCAGLLLAMLLESLVSGQLWYLSNSVLCARIRIQLNTAIYAKTLRRKDISGLSAASKADIEETKQQADLPKSTISAASAAGAASETRESENSPLLASGEQDGEIGVEAGTKATKKKKKKAMFETDESGFGTKSQVLNLFTIDCDRIADFAMWSFSLIDAPAEIIIGAFFLYQLLGVASLVGILSSLVFLPLNHYTSKYYAIIQDRLMAARDRRVSLMNEVLSSIRMIKYMAHEAPFEEKILKTRDHELEQLRKNFHLEVSFNAIWTASPIVCVLVSFLWYTKVDGKVLTPSVAFTSLAVFNELKFALNTIPETLVNALQCLVSLHRIENYFATPEVGPHNPFGDAMPSAPSHDSDSRSVGMRSATISWPSQGDDEASSGANTPMTPSRRRFYLEDVTVAFPESGLSLICGSLGSGKTLFLLSLLGEAELLAGQIICPRSPPNSIDFITAQQFISKDEWLVDSSVAYVPQSAWLQNADIKTNILFGLPLDKVRYDATLEACSLVSDLKVLEDGDRTEIGEKGVVLSGGQKARVSLARAVYSRARTILLDDVLSAVDAHTARHIFENCLKGPIMEGRTVILVSHHVQLCAPGADYVVLLDSGSVAFEGTGKSFRQSPRYKTLAGDTGEDEEQHQEAPAHPEARRMPSKLTNRLFKNVANDQIPQFDSGASSPADSGMSSTEDEESDSEDETPVQAPARKLVDDEGRAVGRVSGKVWGTYLWSNGHYIFWAFFASIFVGSRLMDVLETFVLKLWSGSNDGNQDGKTVHSTDYYLTLYTIVTFSNIVIATVRWSILYNGGVRASRTLYKSLLYSVLRAPLRWFDKMSLGRLLNRFGKDFEGIDSGLPDNLGRSIIFGLGILTTVVTVSFITPFFLVGFIVLCFAYSYYGRLYAKSAREMRRLESVTKSPLFAVYSETITGSAVIRAFGCSARFVSLALQRIDTNVRLYYLLWSCNRWLSIRFSLLSALIVGGTGFFLLQARDRIEASLAGFALTFSLQISGDALFFVRRITALELSLVAVERVKEYSEIELEAPGIIEPRPPANWPHSGKVTVENLTVRYAPELPDVLHALNFRIPPGKKSEWLELLGASTLAQSFFRFVEAWDGCIKIDDIDIKNIGLTDLRSRITIIPQDPQILSGSLRTTLDVFSEFTDQEIFDSLRRVALIPPDDENNEGLNEVVFRNLEAEVSEQGANFSQGERQLLCMARALLRRSKLLLLDEATSSIDYESDALVNKTIRTEFADSTLLVIAHRLRTIIDFDYVLVMDQGKILEYDSPATLLSNKDSRFHALCRATGKSEFRALRRVAEGKPVSGVKKGKGKKVPVVGVSEGKKKSATGSGGAD